MWISSHVSNRSPKIEPDLSATPEEVLTVVLDNADITMTKRDLAVVGKQKSFSRRRKTQSNLKSPARKQIQTGTQAISAGSSHAEVEVMKPVDRRAMVLAQLAQASNRMKRDALSKSRLPSPTEKTAIKVTPLQFA